MYSGLQKSHIREPLRASRLDQGRKLRARKLSFRGRAIPLPKATFPLFVLIRSYLRNKAQAVSDRLPLNPNRAVRIFELFERPAKKFYDNTEWELPEGAVAELVQGDVTIALPRDTAFRDRRI